MYICNNITYLGVGGEVEIEERLLSHVRSRERLPQVCAALVCRSEVKRCGDQSHTRKGAHAFAIHNALVCYRKVKWCPLSNEYGTYKTVEARFRPGLTGKRPRNLSRCSIFARTSILGNSSKCAQLCSITLLLFYYSQA